jgi:hypothetical protein
MASTVPMSSSPYRGPAASLLSPLTRKDRAIASPLADALLFWGAPLVAMIVMFAFAVAAAMLPPQIGGGVAGGMATAMAIITYAHLIAVVPRAYLNPDVRNANPLRLTVVPALLIAALVLSPVALVIGTVMAVLWDVHHSAMQTFGLGRIYDIKAGNDPLTLRRTDLLLNGALYIGPAAAGAAMVVHFQTFDRFAAVGLPSLVAFPALVDGAARGIHLIAIVAWIGIVGTALLSYRRAAARGYTLSAHKLALLVSTATVSIVAWDFAPPALAFMIVNLFHATQYFAIVWLKEGGRLRSLSPRLGRRALPLFLIGCGSFGGAYWATASAGMAHTGAWLAPFIACSLLHFWYDAFVWSVRKRLV